MGVFSSTSLRGSKVSSTVICSAVSLLVVLFLTNTITFYEKDIASEIENKPSNSDEVKSRPETDVYEMYSVEVFKRPITLCGGILKFTSAFCDDGGFCRITGIGKWRGDWEEQIRSSTIEDVDVSNYEIRSLSKLMTKGKSLQIEDSKVKVHYVGDNHRTILDAFVLYFELPKPGFARNAAVLHAKCMDAKAGKSSDKTFPIAYRSRQFHDHIVLIVSQFYSPVDLPWIEMFLRHYIDIGIDIIALYTGFSPQSEYSEKLDSLLNGDQFSKRVVRFEWSDVSGLQSWSHSQTSMINHGVNLFFGCTLISADLDEILYPVKGGTVRSVVDKYNKKYGSWGFNLLSYTPKKPEFARLKNKMHKFKHDRWNWRRVYKTSKPCSYPPSHPSGCRAKWIIHSLEPDVMRIHVIKFGAKAFPKFMPNTTYFPEHWLDPSDLVLIHMRSIQGVKGLAIRYKNGTVTKYNSKNVQAINSGLGAINTEKYLRENAAINGSYTVRVIDSDD